MRGRSIGIASVALSVLAAVCALSAIPARASTVSISFAVSYFAVIPGNPIVPTPPPITPANFVGTQLTGTVSFYAAHVDPTPPLIDIDALNVGDTFTMSFHPADACLGAGSCALKFSFGGTATDGLLRNFTSIAFPGDTILTGLLPQPPPIMPIGTLDILQPQPPPIHAAGIIVGFDDPEVIGQWSVTMSVDTTPLPAALPLFASGLGALGLLGWRRKRKAT